MTEPMWINPLTLRAAKRGLVILEISNLQTHNLENIWKRNVDHNSNKNSPSNILWIFALFKRYFQMYESSRRHFLEKLLRVNGLILSETMKNSRRYTLLRKKAKCNIESCLLFIYRLHHESLRAKIFPGVFVCKPFSPKSLGSNSVMAGLWKSIYVNVLKKLITLCLDFSCTYTQQWMQ